ncbi:MAG TPA: metal-dependent hydrolase, partial [Bacillota bacterium]|nr:metal-dependent hydrolase [Bacillota bacterium]
IVIGIIGYHYGHDSIVLFAIYVGVASLLPHRSYTHSLIGLVCFSYIAYKASIDFGVEQLFLAGSLGYLTHLLLDSRYIPGNRRGISILLPFRRPIL